MSHGLGDRYKRRVCCCCLFIETESLCVAQAGLELTELCLCLLSAGIEDVRYYTQNSNVLFPPWQHIFHRLKTQYRLKDGSWNQVDLVGVLNLPFTGYVQPLSLGVYSLSLVASLPAIWGSNMKNKGRHFYIKYLLNIFIKCLTKEVVNFPL